MLRILVLSVFSFLLFCYSSGYSKISVDFTGYSPAAIVTLMTNFGIDQFESVIISHPFRMYEGIDNNNGMIYDWNDTGNKSQQGGISTLYGDLKGFKDFVDFLHKNKIKVLCRADIFSQDYDFNRDIWKNQDFTSDSLHYQNYAFINLKNDKAKDKVRQMLNAMKSLPIDKWIIDLTKLPEQDLKEYFEFTKGNAGWAYAYFSLLPDLFKGYNNKASSYYYTVLLDTLLMTTNLDDSSIYEQLKTPDTIHIIPDNDMWINHVALGIYFATCYPGTFIPARFLTYKPSQAVLSSISPDTPYSPSYQGMDTMLLYSKSGKKLVGINLSTKLANLKLNNPLPKKGMIKSIFGNYPLYTDEKGSYILIPPGSVYVWEIK